MVAIWLSRVVRDEILLICVRLWMRWGSFYKYILLLPRYLCTENYEHNLLVWYSCHASSRKINTKTNVYVLLVNCFKSKRLKSEVHYLESQTVQYYHPSRTMKSLPWLYHLVSFYYCDSHYFYYFDHVSRGR
jgi:hypothetical protein